MSPHTFLFYAKQQISGSAGRPIECKWLRWLDKISRTILNNISKIGMPHICEVQERYTSFRKENMLTHTRACTNGMNFKEFYALLLLSRQSIRSKFFPFQYVTQTLQNIRKRTWRTTWNMQLKCRSFLKLGREISSLCQRGREKLYIVLVLKKYLTINRKMGYIQIR